MPMSVRFVTARIDKKVLESKRILTTEAAAEYRSELSDVATWWSQRIKSSGRGGANWNTQMAAIGSSVSETRTGKFFMRLGWLGSPPMAEDGRTTWFAYHDSGYHMFGGPQFIPGLMLQMDARDRMRRGIEDANERLARRVEREWGRR